MLAQDLAQPCLARIERLLEERLAVDVEQVEDLVRDRDTDVPSLLESGSGLEQREGWPTRVVERHDLAVDDRLPGVDPVGRSSREVGEVARGIVAVARPEPSLAGPNDGLDAVTVPLDLEEPGRIVEWMIGQGRRHRRDEVGHGDAWAASARHPPRVPRRSAVDCRP